MIISRSSALSCCAAGIYQAAWMFLQKREVETTRESSQANICKTSTWSAGVWRCSNNSAMSTTRTSVGSLRSLPDPPPSTPVWRLAPRVFWSSRIFVLGQIRERSFSTCHPPHRQSQEPSPTRLHCEPANLSGLTETNSRLHISWGVNKRTPFAGPEGVQLGRAFTGQSPRWVGSRPPDAKP